jgi:WD40 repeat protein
VYTAALSADGGLLATGGEDATVRLWDTRSTQMIATLPVHSDAVRSVALSADGQLLASGSREGTVQLWDVLGQRLLLTYQGLAGGLWGVALGADGRLLATGGFDGTVRLWETLNGTYLRTLRSDRRYERADITDLTGVPLAQRAALLALGAVERPHGTSTATAQTIENL